MTLRFGGESNSTFFDATIIYIVCSTKWRHQIQHFEAIQPGVRNELSICNSVDVLNQGLGCNTESILIHFCAQPRWRIFFKKNKQQYKIKVIRLKKFTAK